MPTNKDRIGYLGVWYPCLCIFILKKRGMNTEGRAYMERCKNFEYDYDESKYSLYVYGYWIPYLLHLIEKGLLKQGKANDLIRAYIFSYRYYKL